MRFVEGAYDYEYDPNLKLIAENRNGNDVVKEGSGTREDILNGVIDTMTEEEKAFLEENYR